MSFVNNWLDKISAEICLPGSPKAQEETYDEYSRDFDDPTEKPRLGKYWTIVTAGAGLFSDGYVNNSIGTAGTCLSILYPKEYKNSPAQGNVASIAFVGTVVGQLSFGWIVDHYSRKFGMLLGTVILMLFTVLAAGSWGAHGSIYGMLAALTAYRFFLGIGIGSEYPAGSVACAEATMHLSKGRRNRWFVWFTNFMIDFGFVVSAFVPLVLLWIFGTHHLNAVWRLTIGLGVFPPISLFFLRLRYKEDKRFTKNNFKKTGVPYWLILKFYWRRLFVVSLIWFIYDFSSYSFGIFSSTILNGLIPDGNLYKTFGWNVVFNLFYIPGAFLGAIAADYIGPRLTLAFGVGLQGIIGFIMAARYASLSEHIASFTVVFGIFTALGEFGPGDNIGLICSKTSSTAIRGQYYGLAAAIGKIGAFVGTKVFPIILNHNASAPFYISSSLCIFSAFLALFCLPALTQDSIQEEDIRFREYLSASGFDMSRLGETLESDMSPEMDPVDPIDYEKKSAVQTSAM
ncbi:Git1p [Sugiyamaella lignohabitans]|uniref:Git1p n=1 Tax=Sugiyamaella lignohabitans TaxID=796027 RepID=A0A167FR51_9ASCO|nr:Git1p [Sugiyamaella lignohabitans]ANB15594.1 Git1p [Sugiyamaella lignohabitans]